MASYLSGMSRWLCGSCYRSSPDSKLTCDECQLVRMECEVAGDDGSVPQIPDVEPVASAGPDDDTMGGDLDDASIPLREIFEVNVVLLEYVPMKCPVQWATLLAAALDRVATCNDLKTWQRLLMIAKCCLWVPTNFRGGRQARGKHALSNIIASRLDRWQAGDEEALWDEMNAQKETKNGRRRKKGRPASEEEKQAARAKRRRQKVCLAGPVRLCPVKGCTAKPLKLFRY